MTGPTKASNVGGVFDRGDNVVAELEALLDGSYAELLDRRGRRVPPWAWINLLAHGSEDDLRAAVRARRRPLLDVNMWRHARGYLAGEVLDLARHVGSLEAVQTAALIPLELEHLATPPPRRLRPGQWAVWVLTALEDHRRPTRLPER